jgi:hypothetical protein
MAACGGLSLERPPSTMGKRTLPRNPPIKTTSSRDKINLRMMTPFYSLLAFLSLSLSLSLCVCVCVVSLAVDQAKFPFHLTVFLLPFQVIQYCHVLNILKNFSDRLLA